MAEILFPKRLKFLFEPHPYKCTYGGRFGLKSWSYSRALLSLGASKPLRILCTREVQKSIKDSVHSLLSDQIQALGLGGFYEVVETEIRGKNGTSFVFAGLAQHTIESIKSFEGADIVWVEEARTVSERSWKILLPTIRKPGSEVWVSFNPELDTDPAYVRFVVNPPPGCVTVKTGYQDAVDLGVMSEKIEELRLHDKSTLKSHEYANIWEGMCLPAVQGAIYADEMAKLADDKRLTDIPYDPSLKVHAVWDIGWNDSMSIILVQKHLSALRVIDYMEDNHKTYDWFSAELKKKNLNWGKLWLPHDAYHSTPESGRTPAKILQSLNWEVGRVPNQSIEFGIKTARMALNQAYFDKTKAIRLVECLKRYRRTIPTTTLEPAAPMHDEYSHGADAFRYLALVAPMLSNEELFGKKIKYPNMGIV